MSKLFINEINGLNKVAHLVRCVAVAAAARRGCAAACISHHLTEKIIFFPRQMTLSLYLHEVMDEKCITGPSERAHTIATLALANEVVVADIEVEADPPGRVHPYWAGLGW
jgi:hypothetical protein